MSHWSAAVLLLVAGRAAEHIVVVSRLLQGADVTGAL